MKPAIKLFTLFGSILLLITSSPIYAQNNTGILRYQNAAWNLWTVEANAGFLSAYCDLSSQDNNFINKIKYESGPAISINVTKHFNRLLAASGQLLAGNLHGSSNNSSFKANILEYNLNIKFNLLNLFYPDNKGKFGMTTFAGIGQFHFSSTKSVYIEGGDEITKHVTKAPEFIYFAGAGAFLRTTDKFGISMDISLRQCQNDKLDVLIKSNNFDYYTYLSLGVTYYFDRMNRTQMKNKARIAHNNSKIKHL